MIRTDLEKISDRVWITERCHMQAEKRNRFLELYFHVTLALYSLSTLGISLFPAPKQDVNVINMAAFTSIFTLALSLLVFGFKFGETAAQHRSCYLSLQRLRSTVDDDPDKLNLRYIDILSYYPNHSSGDYSRLVLANLFSRKQELKNPNGEAIEISVYYRFAYVLEYLLVRLAMLLFFVFPIYLLVAGSGFFKW